MLATLVRSGRVLLQTLLAAGGPWRRTPQPSFDRNGWFIGGGVENNLDFFGIAAPGWFMKTEYRSAFYDRMHFRRRALPSAAVRPAPLTFKPWTQTISTSLVYRFNWGGAPVSARY